MFVIYIKILDDNGAMCLSFKNAATFLLWFSKSDI